jgi:hypothetical protein
VFSLLTLRLRSDSERKGEHFLPSSSTPKPQCSRCVSFQMQTRLEKLGGQHVPLKSNQLLLIPVTTQLLAG